MMYCYVNIHSHHINRCANSNHMQSHIYVNSKFTLVFGQFSHNLFYNVTHLIMLWVAQKCRCINHASIITLCLLYHNIRLSYCVGVYLMIWALLYDLVIVLLATRPNDQRALETSTTSMKSKSNQALMNQIWRNALSMARHAFCFVLHTVKCFTNTFCMKVFRLWFHPACVYSSVVKTTSLCITVLFSWKGICSPLLVSLSLYVYFSNSVSRLFRVLPWPF